MLLLLMKLAAHYHLHNNEPKYKMLTALLCMFINKKKGIEKQRQSVTLNSVVPPAL